MAGAYLVIGPIALGLDLYLWGIALGLMTLVVGFVASTIRMVGAGDAKFAAAMAPFFVGSNARLDMGLFAACLLGAFAAHRLLRATPFRRAVPDWASWTHPRFPMGLGLAGMLIFHLLATVWLNSAAVH